MILVDDGLTRELRHTHDTVGPVHTVLLDTIDGGVHLTTTAVEVGSMHVDTQRLAAHLLGMNTSGEGQPIVSVDDIKLFGTGHLTSDDRVVVDLLVQVAGIAACKLHRTEVVDVHIIEVGIDMVTKLEIVVGIHDITHTLTYIVIVHIAPGDGNGVHSNDAAGMLALITEGMRQAEGDIHIALSLQTLGDTIVGSSESTKYVRRILPSKH